MQIEIDKIADAAAGILKTYFEQEVGAVYHNHSVGRDRSHYFNLSVSGDLGIMGLICKSVEYRVRADTYADEDTAQIWCNIGLSYTHHNNGTNGSDIVTVWFDRDYKFIQLRKADGTEIIRE